jgi:hypothetical protein
MFTPLLSNVNPAGKDPRPEDVALICPQRRLVNFELKSIVL